MLSKPTFISLEWLEHIHFSHNETGIRERTMIRMTRIMSVYKIIYSASCDLFEEKRLIR